MPQHNNVSLHRQGWYHTAHLSYQNSTLNFRILHPQQCVTSPAVVVWDSLHASLLQHNPAPVCYGQLPALVVHSKTENRGANCRIPLFPRKCVLHAAHAWHFFALIVYCVAGNAYMLQGSTGDMCQLTTTPILFLHTSIPALHAVVLPHRCNYYYSCILPQVQNAACREAWSAGNSRCGCFACNT